jgi:hypothetical protein
MAEWCSYSILLRFVNLNLFKAVESRPKGLKLSHQGSLQWSELHTKFHKNLPVGSKVIRGTGR